MKLPVLVLFHEMSLFSRNVTNPVRAMFIDILAPLYWPGPPLILVLDLHILGPGLPLYGTLLATLGTPARHHCPCGEYKLLRRSQHEAGVNMAIGLELEPFTQQPLGLQSWLSQS